MLFFFLLAHQQTVSMYFKHRFQTKERKQWAATWPKIYRMLNLGDSEIKTTTWQLMTPDHIKDLSKTLLAVTNQEP